GKPAATLGSMCTCTGPPDSIVMGSGGVFIGGKPAARMGDSCAHGGAIVMGEPTVLIGEAGGGGAGAASITSGMIKGLEFQIDSKLTQSATLKAAALSGKPFCAVCEKSEQEKTQEEKEEQEKKPKLIECYFENKNGEIIDELPDEGKVIFVVKSENMSGEIVDIEFKANEGDFIYKGAEIENGVLKDMSINSDEQKIELEIKQKR
ncbi:MAG: PAAR domain-containing protein, partial [Chitinophagales bacterium]